MGGETSKPINFQLNHPKFTNSKLLVNGKDRLIQTMIGIDSTLYESWKNRLSKANPTNQFLLLPVKHEFSSKGLCGSSGTATLDFNDYPYLLVDEIANRKGKKKLFSENEIWYLMFGLLSAKNSMDPPFSKVGDIRPENIFINDQSDFKVSNVYSWPQEVTNYTKALDNEVTYLAPEEIRQLGIGTLEGESNWNSELFSIGLTLLSAATLDDFNNVYDIKKLTFDDHRVSEKLNEFKLNRAYSDILKGVICNICEFEDSRRVSSQELWTWIQPHEKSITIKENFFIPSAPEKIHQQVASVRHFINSQSSSVGILPLGHSIHQMARQSPFSGQKLNFPPPIIRSSLGDNASVVHTYTGFTNPIVFNAESTYIPAPPKGNETGPEQGSNSETTAEPAKDKTN